MRQMLTELGQIKKDESALRTDMLACIKDVRKLQMKSVESHPEISVKAAEAERLRREVNAAVLLSESVAPVAQRRDALIAERKELIEECAELGSRSNRVAAAEREATS